MEVHDVQAVKVYQDLVQGLLDKAAEIKKEGGVEPPLSEKDFGSAIRQAQQTAEEQLSDQGQQAHYAAVEIVFREIFYELVHSTLITDPRFIHVWNLLDIISIFSDNELCEPALIFWLVEELLDSQTIEGCRIVFDYLESRRERNIAKHFKQKSLTILRSCNELLRRLSRAEDTVFCGRVFIFLFQSFPLGDKSSVNLRGEFHTDNVTTYDESARTEEVEGGRMQIDAAPEKGDDGQKEGATPSEQKEELTAAREEKKPPQVELDELYPVFWSLQRSFSMPTSLFDQATFTAFKQGLESTLSTFRSVRTEQVRTTSKDEEESRRSLKRKRVEDGIETMNTFNPKYLTSRDLFELEVNDAAFRRHILVQALIVLDFMLSLTPSAKTKLANSTNKSVLYGYTLGEEDARWVTETKAAIANYLQEGNGGKFYYRMVDTVLTRDKNWVRWKAEGCPPIAAPSVTVEDYQTTGASAQKMAANKRIRLMPLGSLDLRFLSEDADKNGMGRLKETERFINPRADSYLRGIADDEFNEDMAQSPEEKEDATKSKTSKRWRTLRLTSRNGLARFDLVDDDNRSLHRLFEPDPPAPDETPANAPANESKLAPAAPAPVPATPTAPTATVAGGEAAAGAGAGTGTGTSEEEAPPATPAAPAAPAAGGADPSNSQENGS